MADPVADWRLGGADARPVGAVSRNSRRADGTHYTAPAAVFRVEGQIDASAGTGGLAWRAGDAHARRAHLPRRANRAAGAAVVRVGLQICAGGPAKGVADRTGRDTVTRDAGLTGWAGKGAAASAAIH